MKTNVIRKHILAQNEQQCAKEQAGEVSLLEDGLGSGEAPHLNLFEPAVRRKYEDDNLFQAKQVAH
jgi:hypothetical protein